MDPGSLALHLVAPYTPNRSADVGLTVDQFMIVLRLLKVSKTLSVAILVAPLKLPRAF